MFRKLITKTPVLSNIPKHFKTSKIRQRNYSYCCKNACVPANKAPILNLMQTLYKTSKILQRNYSYYCKNPCVPIIPACYWTVLPNGVRVISEQTCSALASVSMFIDTGPQHEVPCNNGITYFIGRLAFQGSKGFNKCLIEEKIRSIGARLDCKTTREYQIFTATCPPVYIADMLELLSKILNQLDFCYIENAKRDLCHDLIDAENDPEQLCFDYLHKCAFQGTSLSLPVIGPFENYLRFDAEYVANYIKETYTPTRIIISCSAALTHEQVVCAVTNLFSCLRDPPCEFSSGPGRFTGSQILFRHDGMPFSHTSIAVEAPGYSSGSYLAFRVLVEMLGSWDKSQGRGYSIWPGTAQYAAMGDMCDSYKAFYIPYGDVGLFGVYFVAANGTSLDDMVYNVQTHLMKMCNNMTESDFTRAKNRLKLKLAKEVDGAQNACLDMAVQMCYYGMRKNLCAEWSAVDNMMITDTKALAMKYIYDRCVACSSVGPTESLPDYNRIRSGMYWLRI